MAVRKQTFQIEQGSTCPGEGVFCGAILGEKSSSGQSVLEFIFTLPLLIGLSILLLRINSAISISIVNQQYARAQALYVAFNSPFFPEMNRKVTMIERKQNAFLVGISAEPAPEDQAYVPSAPVYNIARNKRLAGMASNENGLEPMTRANIRVRSTVTLCAESQFIGTGGKIKAVLAHNAVPPFRPIGFHNMVEGVIPNNFCWSGLRYE